MFLLCVANACTVLILLGGINDLIDVRFNLNGTITCIFKAHNQPPGVKYCNASISYGINCATILGVYEGSSTSNMVTITAPVNTITNVTEYCYNITATAQNVKVNQIVVEGVVQRFFSNGKP